jgi:hypothetical protein
VKSKERGAQSKEREQGPFEIRHSPKFQRGLPHQQKSL